MIKFHTPSTSVFVKFDSIFIWNLVQVITYPLAHSIFFPGPTLFASWQFEIIKKLKNLWDHCSLWIAQDQIIHLLNYGCLRQTHIPPYREFCLLEGKLCSRQFFLINIKEDEALESPNTMFDMSLNTWWKIAPNLWRLMQFKGNIFQGWVYKSNERICVVGTTPICWVQLVHCSY